MDKNEMKNFPGLETNGFKVVHRDQCSGALVSAVVRNTPVLRTIYEVGAPARNLFGPLLFFPELKDAELFRRTYTNLDHAEIWSCEATNASPCPHVVWNVTRRKAMDVRDWWRYDSALEHAPAPPGTYAADTITLIERMDS